jgi:DNA-binding response OmpR family regulator
MTNQGTIILVEDDTFISGMYMTKLSSLGWEVEVIEDGNAAWERLQQDPLPDLLLLDVVLPKKDGFEILAGLKKDDRLKDVPVILLTNLGQKPDVERGVKLGADDYIIKAHFTPTEVVDKIRQLLAKKR